MTEAVANAVEEAETGMEADGGCSGGGTSHSGGPRLTVSHSRNSVE